MKTSIPTEIDPLVRLGAMNSGNRGTTLAWPGARTPQAPLKSRATNWIAEVRELNRGAGVAEEHELASEQAAKVTTN
jgi:hypothetical protein